MKKLIKNKIDYGKGICSFNGRYRLRKCGE